MTLEIIRSSVEIRDASDRLVRIERIWGGDAPALVLVTYEAPGDVASLTGDILQGLQQNGVRIEQE